MSLRFLRFTPFVYCYLIAIEGFYRYGWYSQIVVIPGFPEFVYVAYPFSLFIFGSLGIYFTKKYGYSGIALTAMCAFSFDLYGALINDKGTQLIAYPFWIITIAVMTALVFLNYKITFQPRNLGLIFCIVYFELQFRLGPLNYLLGEPLGELLWSIAFIQSVKLMLRNSSFLATQHSE